MKTAKRTLLPDARPLSILLLALLAGCAGGQEVKSRSGEGTVEVQGHRGARGLLPENTIPSFLKAVDLGADTIELDVVVSADSKVVVSHEPWFSPEICSGPEGDPVREDEARDMNIYQMPYAEVARFDCGSRGNPRFPTQQAMAVAKPQLSDAIAAIERHLSDSGLDAVAYNIEIKSKPEGDGVYHPEPDRFARMVYDILAAAGVLDRTTIQSFDPRALEAVHEIDSTVRLALLVENELGLRPNLDRLSFKPDIYSPNHPLVDARLVRDAHEQGIEVIPWTVNDEDTMRALLVLGVDGLITDYPDRGRRVVDALP